MTKNTNIKIKFQQKCKTKNIPALLRAGQNLVNELKNNTNMFFVYMVSYTYLYIIHISITYIHTYTKA